MIQYFDNLKDSQQIEHLIKQVVESEKMELVEVEYGGKPRLILRIFIYKEGGVAHSDCAKISSQIGELFETNNVIDEKFILEVSSPGLDRPLKTGADYKRNKGNRVKLWLNVPIEGKKTWVGQIVDARNKKVQLKEKSNNIIAIPIAEISKGKLEI